MSDIDFFFDANSYLDSKPFKAYRADVVRVITEAGQPIPIRKIHELLGDAAKPEWTADALEMATDIEPIGILPTRCIAKPKARRT